MRTPRAAVIYMDWRSCALLAWTVLMQAASAVEQRHMLRAQRASEAVPIVTLPQSLLLQSTNGEDAHNKVIRRARMSYLSEGEGGHEEADIDGDEDEDDDGEGDEETPTAIVSTKTAAPDAPTSGHALLSVKKNTTNATTAATTASGETTTTQDPAILYAAQKKANETTESRKLLVAMITEAQTDLLKRLHDIDIDLDVTELRAQQDLKAVNYSFAQASNMPIMARNAEVDVQKIEDSGTSLKEKLPILSFGAANASEKIAGFLSVKENVTNQIDATQGLSGAKSRVETNQQTMNALYPRLAAMEKKVFTLEGKLYGGNMTKVVNDATREEVMNIFEDVSRGFGRFYENQEQP